MKLSKPYTYGIKLGKYGRYKLESNDDIVKFTAPVSSAGIPKLYTISINGLLHYIGISTQRMSTRLHYGLNATGKNGYHGYKWKNERKNIVLTVWVLNGADKEKAYRVLETIEAEVAFLCRSQTGRWPLSQHEIHFHESGNFHRACAKSIFKHIASRSYEKLTKQDLFRLAEIARQDRKDFFDHNTRWKRLYSNRIVCVALCQGAALHYLDGKNGIKDFDVWTFYEDHASAPFPYRRIGHRDFGKSKFGRLVNDIKDYEGRRVDLIGRSIYITDKADPAKALREYLSGAATSTAKALAKKAVIILEPKRLLGKVVWQQESI